MKLQPNLFEEVSKYKDYLSIQGISQIDYNVKFEQNNRKEIVNIIKNFKKSLLWRLGKTYELDNFDELYS